MTEKSTALVTIKPEDYDRSQWLGGGDIASVVGVAPPGWRSILGVWQSKVSPKPEEVNALKRRLFARGRFVEPLVQEYLASEYNIETFVKNQRSVDPVIPYFCAEIDAEIPLGKVSHLFSDNQLGDADPDEPTNVEIKSVGAFSTRGWGTEGSDDVPLHVGAQVQWGMGITGRRFAMAAALFGADQLRLYPIVRDDVLIESMRDQANRFWIECVLANIAPAPRSLEDVKALWPDDNAYAIDLTDTTKALIDALRIVTARRLLLQKSEEGLEWLLRDAIKDAVEVRDGENVLATLKQQNTTSIDADKLKAEFPAIYHAVVRRGKTRVLRLKKQED